MCRQSLIYNVQGIVYVDSQSEINEKPIKGPLPAFPSPSWSAPEPLLLLLQLLLQWYPSRPVWISDAAWSEPLYRSAEDRAPAGGRA